LGYNLFIGCWAWDTKKGEPNTSCEQNAPWLLANARKKAIRVDSPGNPPIMADEMNYDAGKSVPWTGYYHHPNREDVVSPASPKYVFEPGGGGHTLFLSGAVDWYEWEELLAESEAEDHTPQLPFYPNEGFARKGFAGWEPRDDQVAAD